MVAPTASELVMTGANKLIVSMREAVGPVPVPLLADNVTGNTPVCVGVPEMSPVKGLTERPVGRPVALKPVGAFAAVI